jgi:hypothetical protein
MNIQRIIEIKFIAFAAGIIACGLAGRFTSSGKRALVLCLVPLVALALAKAFC